jgi:hypothetical protein
MGSRLLDVYRGFTNSLEADIAVFERKSRDLLEGFKAVTDDVEEMKKLSIIETQITMRSAQVRQLGKSILANIENASLALHSPDITDWISEEQKKKNAGTPSERTGE